MTMPLLASSAGAVDSALCPWLPTGGCQTARKPVGGFIDCPIDVLTLPWWHYRQGALELATLRVWLGTLELVEKRCGAAPEVPAHYGPDELRRLLRWPRLGPVTAAVQQLEALGLLAWSPQAIQFLPQAEVLREALAQDGYQTLRAQCAPGLRWVPVPRRLLRWLAQEGQPGLIATACGVLLRCMRYKARQCVAGGRVAAPWIATVFGVAERTVQRAFTTLEACGWLARLAGQPERERLHGRYTVINLAWQRPGTAETPRHERKAAAAPEEPAMASCRNLSPQQGRSRRNLSPIAERDVSVSTENTEACGADPAPVFFQPFQEAQQDPEPTGSGPTGALTQAQSPEEHGRAILLPASEDEEVTEDAYAAAKDRLVAQGTDPALLIRPVVLAEVQRARQEAAHSPSVVASGQAAAMSAALEETPAPAAPLPAPTPCSPARHTPQAPHTPVPACLRTSTRLPPPTLRDVTRADLSDVGRLLALHQQAMARGWLRGGEAAQLTVVAAAVHARRVGQAPCRLFVALLRDQRWEVITQEDEDQAHALLRAYRSGPVRRLAVEAGAPEPDAALADDARFALLAPQVLRQAGWRGEPFLGVKLHDPTWTRERWDRAQAALAKWQRQQVQARWQRSGLEPLALDGEGGEQTTKAEPDEDD
ncbi:MAG: hypothetical protein AB7N91_14710 [Candidatus Tectimicrobiota bacterium]